VGICSPELTRGTIERGCGTSLVTYARLLLKTTAYFREQVLRKRPYLRSSWIDRVLASPVVRSVQPDGRIRFWGYVSEIDRWLRVVTLADGQTVHNAFPDRDFRPGPKL